MASAGQYGVNIGSGAATGAGFGSTFGPIGAVVGGGIGALGGALSTLLSSSDEAKQRERAKQAYLQQMQERYQQDRMQRFAAITGLGSNPMYIALGGMRNDPEQWSKDFDNGMPAEPTPNYGGLISSLGQLGGTVGANMRADSLANLRNASNQTSNIAASGNPWINYSLEDRQKELDDLIEQARRNSPGVL